MRQLNKSDNQFGSLDREKIYFIEKFGYLIKKVNGEYGSSVKEVLFDRITGAVNDFKSDLPIIIQNLEINRLKSIFNRNKEKVDVQDRQSDYKSVVSSKSVEATKAIRAKIGGIHKTITQKIKADVQIKSEKLQERQTQSIVAEKPLLKHTVIENEIDIPIDDILLSKQSKNIENKISSILRPSVAKIKEEQRLEQIKAMQQKKESFKTESMMSKHLPAKPKTKPIQELTEWERRWHKHDSDMVDQEFDGYLNN